PNPGIGLIDARIGTSSEATEASGISVPHTGAMRTIRAAVLAMSAFEDKRFETRIGMIRSGKISRCRDSLTKPFNQETLKAVPSKDEEERQLPCFVLEGV